MRKVTTNEKQGLLELNGLKRALVGSYNSQKRPILAIHLSSYRLQRAMN
jgi:hypothetical protein